MSGKGSKPRPLSISYEEYSDNFDNIFRKKRVVEVKELPDGDQFIELPNDMVKGLGWKEGDDIEWKDNKNGTFDLTKKERKYNNRNN